ncbi:MAG TPA: GNAT family N-acetyltransferase [Candidatus Saccharimonadia bacterium]|nr:GNAT family N-acetyltransferase [Candidatus Saccharimonadia bacterium]
MLPIRGAVEADMPRIVEIHDQSLPAGATPLNYPPGHPRNWDTWWKSHTPSLHPIWVYEEGGRVMAWVRLSPLYRQKVFRSTVQCSLYVAPEAQRRGIGTRLVTHVMEACPALGIRTLLAFISPQNKASLKIFRRAWLEPWGDFPGSASHADAIDMVMLGRKLN